MSVSPVVLAGSSGKEVWATPTSPTLEGSWSSAFAGSSTLFALPCPALAIEAATLIRNGQDWVFHFLCSSAYLTADLVPVLCSVLSAAGEKLSLTLTSKAFSIPWADCCHCSVSVMSDSLWPHGLQHASLSCPSSSPGACSNSSPWSQWCHPTISSCPPISSCPQPWADSWLKPIIAPHKPQQVFETVNKS